MNMELFRYLTVAQLEQKAITGLKITNESQQLGLNVAFLASTKLLIL